MVGVAVAVAAAAVGLLVAGLMRSASLADRAEESLRAGGGARRG